MLVWVSITLARAVASSRSRWPSGAVSLVSALMSQRRSVTCTLPYGAGVIGLIATPGDRYRVTSPDPVEYAARNCDTVTATGPVEASWIG